MLTDNCMTLSLLFIAVRIVSITIVKPKCVEIIISSFRLLKFDAGPEKCCSRFNFSAESKYCNGTAIVRLSSHHTVNQSMITTLFPCKMYGLTLSGVYVANLYLHLHTNVKSALLYFHIKMTGVSVFINRADGTAATVRNASKPFIIEHFEICMGSRTPLYDPLCISPFTHCTPTTECAFRTRVHTFRSHHHIFHKRHVYKPYISWWFWCETFKGKRNNEKMTEKTKKARDKIEKEK